MVIARQSTARTVMIGPILDADGVAVTDGVVGDLKISKNGGAPAALNGSATLTHRNTGHYSLALTTSDLDTVGQAEIVIDDTVNACPVKVITVVEEAVYDMLFAASALGYIANAPVNVAQFGGSNGTFASGRPEVNTTLIEGSDATNQIRDAVVDDATRIDASALNTLSSHDPGEAIMGATDLGTGAGLTSLASQASVNTIDDLLDTEIGALTTELAKVPKSDGTATWNATALAAIQQQAEDALVAHDAPTNTDLDARTLAAASYATAAAQATAQGTLDKLDDTLEDDGGTFRFTANALEEAPAGGGGGGDATEAKQDAIIALIGTPAVDLATDIASRASQSSVDDLPTNAELGTALDALPTAGENATAVWGAGTRVLTAGTNIALAKGTGVTGFNDLSAAQVNAEVDTALADYDGPTKAELDAGLAAADDAVLAAIAALNNVSVANILAATVEGSTTLVQTLRLLNSALGGKASGLETTTAVYRDIGDTKDRITATVDADGNRTAVTLDLT